MSAQRGLLDELPELAVIGWVVAYVVAAIVAPIFMIAMSVWAGS